MHHQGKCNIIHLLLKDIVLGRRYFYLNGIHSELIHSEQLLTCSSTVCIITSVTMHAEDRHWQLLYHRFQRAA